MKIEKTDSSTASLQEDMLFSATMVVTNQGKKLWTYSGTIWSHDVRFAS